MAPAGVVAVICVALLTVNEAAAVTPKFTAVAPVKLVPVMVTDVPPAVDPEFGLTLLTVGAAMKLKLAPQDLVPPGVVTDTLTGPAECAGVVAVIEVALTTVTLVAAAPPNVTAVAPVKLAPVIVTDVPPAAGPEFGLTLDTDGGAA